jgi:hypothetical protein
MKEEKSAEQAIEEFKLVLGEEFGQLFYALHNDLVWLVVKWQQFQKLYETNSERIEVMNKTAPFFFRMIEFTLWESIVLQIARLTDPPRSVGKDNLTVKRLPDYIKSESKRKIIEGLIGIADLECSFARDWRNRHIAHRDLSLAINLPVTKLAEANKSIVETALKSLENVLDIIHGEYFDTQFMYEFGSYSGDAHSLLHHLRNGWESQERIFERIKNGTVTEEDYKNYNRAL